MLYALRPRRRTVRWCCRTCRLPRERPDGTGREPIPEGLRKKRPAASSARCNTLGECSGGRFEVQGLAGPLIELTSDGIEPGLGEGFQVRASWEVLAQQAIGILVGAALPRAVRVAEVHLDVGGDGEV